LLLSVAGAVVGLLFANAGIGAIVKFFADRLPYATDISMDGSVLGFTAALAVVVGVLAGLLPAIWFTRTNLDEALKQGQSRGSSDSGGNKTRAALVMGEVALSLVLLVGAGLMVRTLSTLSSVKPGFDPNHLLTMSIPVPANKFPTPSAQAAFFERVLRQVRATPGVQSAGMVDSLPLSGGSSQPVSIAGQPALPMADQPEVDVRLISTGYLSTMHVPLLSGRDLTEADVAERTPVALISESMAKRFWPNENPLGRQLTLTFYPGVAREIIGVVGDVKLDSLQQTRPVAAVYWPYNQYFVPSSETWRSFGTSLALRTNAEPSNVIAAVTDAVRQVDPETPVVDVIGMNDLIAKSLSPQRFNLLLLAAFAGLALVLTAVGIYSVLSYMVRRRFREIGIRMAMGATPTAVLRLVVGDGMKPILLGVGVGLAAALGLGRVVSSLLYGVSATDPLTFALVAVLLVAVGLLATALPAYRATQVEPVKTLREE
jgi:predicted permease